MRTGLRHSPGAKRSAGLAVDYPFVPVPTAFFDVLPSLSGAESKVLLCVTRQTAGWRTVSGERKQSDWISQSQFKAKTGLASAAISHAIDSLVRQHLLVADDGRGNLLTTAADRRRVRGRVYFSATPVFQTPHVVDVTDAGNTFVAVSLKSGIRKANRTKESSPTKELSVYSGMKSPGRRGGTTSAPSHPAPERAGDLLPVSLPKDPRNREDAEGRDAVEAAKERCRRTLETLRR